MIQTIFITLVLLAFFLVIVGYWTNQTYLEMVGYTFLFISGVALMNTGIQYIDGENLSINETNVYVYGNNFTGYHWDYASTPPSCSNPAQSDSCVWLFHSNTTRHEYKVYDYDLYENTQLGIYLAMIGAIGFVISFWRYRRDTRE